jgi:hypothetical protein
MQCMQLPCEHLQSQAEECIARPGVKEDITCTMSAIWRDVCAVLARALSVSFLLLASTIFDSSILRTPRQIRCYRRHISEQIVVQSAI